MNGVLSSRWLPDPIERANLLLSAGAVAASVAFAPPRFAASLAIGVCLEVVNFRALRRAAKRLLAGELGGAGVWVGLFGLRFGLLGVAMYLALDAGANPVGLVLGLSFIVPAAIWVAWQGEPPAPTASSYVVPPPDDPSWDDWNPWLAREREADEDIEVDT